MILHISSMLKQQIVNFKYMFHVYNIEMLSLHMFTIFEYNDTIFHICSSCLIQESDSYINFVFNLAWKNSMYIVCIFLCIHISKSRLSRSFNAQFAKMSFLYKILCLCYKDSHFYANLCSDLQDRYVCTKIVIFMLIYVLSLER